MNTVNKCKYCKYKSDCTALKSMVWLLKWGLLFIGGSPSWRTYPARYIANICPFYNNWLVILIRGIIDAISVQVRKTWRKATTLRG